VSKDSLYAWAPLLAGCVWAFMLAWWFWDYIKALTGRLPGESIREAIGRSSRERALDKQARERMFGSRTITALASLVCLGLNMAMLATLAWSSAWGGAMLAYLAVGLVVMRRYNLRAHASWDRLSFRNRLWFRLTHAWLWPLHLVLGGDSLRHRDERSHDINRKGQS